VNAAFVHIEVGQDVVPGFPGHGDNGFGIFQGCFFHPAAHMVPGAQLFHLPGTKGLQRVCGENLGDVPQFFGHISGHGRVPGMGVHNLCVKPVPGHAQAAMHGVQGADKSRIGVMTGLIPGAVPFDDQVLFPDILMAESAHFHRNHPGQFPRQVLHMHACPSIDGWRVLVGKNSYFL